MYNRDKTAREQSNLPELKNFKIIWTSKNWKHDPELDKFRNVHWRISKIPVAAGCRCEGCHRMWRAIHLRAAQYSFLSWSPSSLSSILIVIVVISILYFVLIIIKNIIINHDDNHHNHHHHYQCCTILIFCADYYQKHLHSPQHHQHHHCYHHYQCCTIFTIITINNSCCSQCSTIYIICARFGIKHTLHFLHVHVHRHMKNVYCMAVFTCENSPIQTETRAWFDCNSG